MVETEGVEPSSKQGTRKLSTCLVASLSFCLRMADDSPTQAPAR